jgi:hypothetical protein
VDAKAQFRSRAEPWADTGTSTGRLMLAVLGGLADVERDLSAPGQPKAEAAPRLKGSTWGGPLSARPNRKSRGRRYVARVGAQLRRGHIHHSAGDESNDYSNASQIQRLGYILVFGRSSSVSRRRQSQGGQDAFPNIGCSTRSPGSIPSQSQTALGSTKPRVAAIRAEDAP